MTEMTECEKEIIALKMRINWLQGERDFYRDERDEAQRLYCVMLDGYDGLTCKDWADRKGWDCFKET